MTMSQIKNIESATHSRYCDFALLLILREIKEKIQLNMKSIISMRVISSMREISLRFWIFKAVSTTKHIPRRFEDAQRM